MRRRTRWWATISAAVVIVAVLAAVSLGGLTSGGDAVSPSSTSGGERVAPIKLTTLEGEAIELPAGRPGAAFFTVSSCLSCISSARALGELKAEYGSRADAIWIGIDPNDPPAAVRERRRSLGDPSYPFAIDRSGTLAGQYGVQALGTTIVYDARGKLVTRLIEPTEQQLRAAFQRAGVQ